MGDGNQSFPEMPDGNFDKLIPGMFYFAKWFIGQFDKFIMIGIAVALAGALLIMLVGLFDRSKDRKKDEDDDDGVDFI